MFKYLVVNLLLFSFSNLTAQDPVPQETPQVSTRPSVFTNEELDADIFGIYNSGRNSRVLYDFNATESTGIGSPFIMDFRLAKIDGYDHNYLIRYDAYNDEMQAKNSKNQIVIINRGKVAKVTFDDGSRYELLTYQFEKKEITGYLKVVYSGQHISLLKKETVVFLPAQKAKSSYQPATPDTFKRQEDSYFTLKISDGSIVPLMKKKDFLNRYGSKKKALETFIKSNKLKFSKEEDLVQLVAHLDAMEK